MNAKALGSILAALVLAACASYGIGSLKPGEAVRADVLRTMGEPAMRWPLTGGGEQLAYPQGPMGYHTYMVYLDAQGRLLRAENALDSASFARVQAGMSQEEVLRLLGPAEASWTVYFAARDELAWEWRYCDAWNETARFNVLFDASRGTVRSTLSLTEAQRGLCWRGRCGCAR